MNTGFLNRNLTETCLVCAEICRECAIHCSVYLWDECARICNECADACMKVASLNEFDGSLYWHAGVAGRLCAETCSRYADAFCQTCSGICRQAEEELLTVAIDSLFSNSSYSVARL